jgi:hypothetical protein
VNPPYNTELMSKLQKSIRSIADGSYFQATTNTELHNFVLNLSYSAAKEIIPDLAIAFEALYKMRHTKNLNTAEISRFCYMLGNRLKTIRFSRNDYKHFIENNSYTFLPYIILNEFIPVDLVINGNFEHIPDEYLHKQIVLDSLGWFYKRRHNDIVEYSRKSLSKSIDCSALSDEMVLNIAGVKV